MTTLWTDMFVLTMPWAEKVIRPLLVYLFLVAALRVAGKRLLAQLNPFDLVVLLILSNTVQNAIIGRDDTLTGGLLGAATLLAINHVAVRWLIDHPKVERLVEGAPGVLIEDGVIQPDALSREGISELELRSAAHKQGFESLAEIERAVLDPSGSVFFLRSTATADPAQHSAVMERLERIERLLERHGGHRA